ncbi:MAG: TetR/AcrR family transcriptional regulator [Acidimicrobiia bacterium]
MPRSNTPPEGVARPRRAGRPPASGNGAGALDASTPIAGTPAQGRELRARGRRTLRKLLDAGIEVFARRGYHAARVDDIVKVARTSHGTFYLYFANKEDLFRALVLDVTQAMQEIADRLPPLEPGPEGAAELRAWLDAFADLYEHYGPVIRAWTETEIGDSEFGRLGDDVLTNFSRAFADRLRAVAPAGIDPDVAALAAVAMIERCNYYVVTRQVPISRDEMLDMLTHVVQTGFVTG